MPFPSSGRARGGTVHGTVPPGVSLPTCPANTGCPDRGRGRAPSSVSRPRGTCKTTGRNTKSGGALGRVPSPPPGSPRLDGRECVRNASSAPALTRSPGLHEATCTSGGGCEHKHDNPGGPEDSG
jgi:hypothetical protein